MKKILFLPAALSIMMFAASAYAETAVPTSAVVTVNGAEVNFCAYNLYDSNYFMLRDVASALSGTDKQFNVDWKYHAVTLTGGKAYEPIGTEFSQNAESDENAAFSVPEVTLGGEKITLVGYNIKDSNYFKIRDIARIFDFAVGYEDGHIAIDTSKPYEAGLPYDGGGVIGMAHEANLPLFINEMPLVSYVSPVDTVYSAEQFERINENPRLNGVYVDAADLENYGFDAQIYEDAVWLTRNKEKKFSMLDGEIVNAVPAGISEVYASDMKVYLDGTQTRNVLINGKPYISAAELLKYGDVSEPYGNFYYDIFDEINIDFLRKDLTEKFEAETGGTEVELKDRDVIEAEIPGARLANPNIEFVSRGGTSWKKTDMWKYELAEYVFDSGGNSVRYIGGILNDKENGLGIREKYDKPTQGMSMEERQSGGFERGEFIDGTLVDGISTWKSAAYPPHYRYEGAMVNGYHRESIMPHTMPSSFRFGYCALCEGTIENGEYCGYYREYDDSGKLIFEGDYSDFNKETN